MKIHELKTDPDWFDSVADGRKTSEIRYNDREYHIGDLLLLRRTRWLSNDMKNGKPLEYTGEWLLAKVTHMQSAVGIGEGWVSLSIKVLTTGDW